MAKAKKADCRADTQGGPWVGIPHVVIRSAAYRALTVHSKAALTEITARMNEYNNGAIVISSRELRIALGCSPGRIVEVIKQLHEHGLIEVSVESAWTTRKAREYRLTFVNTMKNGKHVPATNDYVGWCPRPKEAKFAGTEAVAEQGKSATASKVRRARPDTAAVARIAASREKTANLKNAAATAAVPLIDSHTLPAQPAPSSPRPMHGQVANDGAPEEHFCTPCEHCSGKIAKLGSRFCSEACGRAAGLSREGSSGEATPVGDLLMNLAARLEAGGLTS